MFISVWSDPDVGNASDDFIGCDTSLNLAYAYNSKKNDWIYLNSPPAIGFKILKSPINFNGYRLISSFHHGRTGGIYPEEPHPSYAYNEMNGKDFNGNPFINPYTNDSTKFPLSGNPIIGEGWIDGIVLPASDRRMMLNAGPFVMSPSDTQEIVFAEIAALGGDNINALRVLHFNSVYAQELYNNSFNFIPTPISEFDVSSLNLHQYLGSVELIWDDPDLQNVVENYNKDGFTFEGYKLYQLYSEINFPSNGRLIETYDKVNGIKQIYGKIMNPITGNPEIGLAFNGSDSDIKHSRKINWDYINNSYLRPNDKYYYSVNAYFVNPNNLDKTFEVTVAFKEFVFQENLPGPALGDSLVAIHSSGNGEVKVNIGVVDPYSITGHNYKIYFTPNGNYKIYWNLKDLTLGTDVLSNQVPFEEGKALPVVDGFQIKLIHTFGFSSFSVISNSSGILDPPGAGSFHFAGFPTPDNSDPIGGLQQSTNNSRWGIHSADIYRKGTFKSFNNEISENDSLWRKILSSDFELRFTQTGSKGCKIFNNNEIINVPFEMWNIGKDTPDNLEDDYRMIPWIYENVDNMIFDIGGDHSSSTNINDPFTDWFYWVKPSNSQPGQLGYYEAEQKMLQGSYDGDGDSLVMAKMVLVEWNGGSTPPYIADIPEIGTTFRITTFNRIIPWIDEFTFTTERLDTLNYFSNYSIEQNYPNPFNSTTTIKFKLITRVKVVIDLFNIIGEKIVTLVDSEMDPGNYSIQFDASSYASGIYFYQLRAADFIQTKKMLVLK